MFKIEINRIHFKAIFGSIGRLHNRKNMKKKKLKELKKRINLLTQRFYLSNIVVIVAFYYLQDKLLYI